MKKTQMAVVLVIVAVGFLGFFGGIKYQESKSVGSRQFGSTQDRIGSGNAFPNGVQRNGGQQVNRVRFRPVVGEIIDANDTAITVKMGIEGNKIVFVSSKTDINKAQKATIVDLKKGEIVSVFGQENTDRSITAQNIQLNPVFRQNTITPTITNN